MFSAQPITDKTTLNIRTVSSNYENYIIFWGLHLWKVRTQNHFIEQILTRLSCSLYFGVILLTFDRKLNLTGSNLLSFSCCSCIKLIEKQSEGLLQDFEAFSYRYEMFLDIFNSMNSRQPGHYYRNIVKSMLLQKLYLNFRCSNDGSHSLIHNRPAWT